jgi:hypothetical protein
MQQPNKDTDNNNGHYPNQKEPYGRLNVGYIESDPNLRTDVDWEEKLIDRSRELANNIVVKHSEVCHYSSHNRQHKNREHS